MLYGRGSEDVQRSFQRQRALIEGRDDRTRSLERQSGSADPEAVAHHAHTRVRAGENAFDIGERLQQSSPEAHTRVSWEGRAARSKPTSPCRGHSFKDPRRRKGWTGDKARYLSAKGQPRVGRQADQLNARYAACPLQGKFKWRSRADGNCFHQSLGSRGRQEARGVSEDAPYAAGGRARRAAHLGGRRPSVRRQASAPQRGPRDLQAPCTRLRR